MLFASRVRWALVGLLACVSAGGASAQVIAPTTVDLPNFTTVGAGSSLAFGQDGGLTDAAGTPGTNPGYTLFRYGNPTGGTGRLRIASTSVSAATLGYDTATPASPTVNAAPANFNASTAYSFTVIAPKPGATSASPLQVSDNDTNPTTVFLPLNNTADLSSYNARLNAILKFDASQFIDPATNQAILTTGPNAVGQFSFSFSNFDAGVGVFRDISLVYTPVPEPATALGLAALGATAWAGLRRRRPPSGDPAIGPGPRD